MAPNWYRAGAFELRAFEKLSRDPASAPLVVYIESDGYAWADRNTLSADPTPVRPVLLNMAARDPASAVAYLARPCQYLDAGALRRCGSAYWSEARFAPEVVTATDDAISQILQRSGRTSLILVGYSGGGVVATLVAARRSDVIQLITVASPLDHAAWTGLHGVSPLNRSLNPAQDAARLAGLPQVHYIGARDTIVPVRVVESYISRLSAPHRAQITVVPDQSHDCCWADVWPDLLARTGRAAEMR